MLHKEYKVTFVMSLLIKDEILKYITEVNNHFDF